MLLMSPTGAKVAPCASPYGAILVSWVRVATMAGMSVSAIPTSLMQRKSAPSLLDPRLGFVELSGQNRDREAVVSVGCGILDQFKPNRPECHDHDVGLVRQDVEAQYTCITFPGFTSVSDTD